MRSLFNNSLREYLTRSKSCTLNSLAVPEYRAILAFDKSVDEEVNHLIEGRIETARQLHNSTKAVQQKLRSEVMIRRLWKDARRCEQETDQRARLRTRGVNKRASTVDQE
jgi:uncharacterized membrane protein YccC